MIWPRDLLYKNLGFIPYPGTWDLSYLNHMAKDYGNLNPQREFEMMLLESRGVGAGHQMQILSIGLLFSWVLLSSYFLGCHVDHLLAAFYT